MNSSNQNSKLNQFSPALLQPLTDEQSGFLVGGASASVIFALNRSASRSEPSATDFDCFVSDIGGDAVIAEAPTFFAKLPFISPLPMPQ